MLPNGLTVLVKEVRNAPVVSFSVWYRAGSRNEHTGITGVSHLLEHMLFKGTQQYRLGEIARTLFLNGASFNASTYYDWTNYYATIAADRLELAMRIEADRMVNSRIDKADLDAEMTVVRSELEGGENSPGPAPLAGGGVGGLPGPPLPLAGDRLAERRRERVPGRDVSVLPDPLRPRQRGRGRRRRRHGRRRAPAGPEALRLRSSRSPKPPEVHTVEPPQRGERRVTVRRSGSLPMVLIAWKAPAALHPDTYALDVLSGVLGEGRTSRLYQALVEKGVASRVDAGSPSLRDPFLFYVSATARPGVTAERLETALLEEVERVTATPITAEELARAQRRAEADFVFQTNSVTAQARQLGYWAMIGDWRYLTTYLDRIRALTAADDPGGGPAHVQRRHPHGGPLRPGRRRRRPRRRPPRETSARVDRPKRGDRPIPLPRPSAAKAPSRQVSRFTLPNGISVIVQESRATPTFALRASVAGRRAGGAARARPGVAGLTASMLSRGTERRSALEFATALEDVGAALGAGADTLVTTVTGPARSRRDFDLVMDLFAEMLRQPSFPGGGLRAAQGRGARRDRPGEDQPGPRRRPGLRAGRVSRPGHPLRPHTFEERRRRSPPSRATTWSPSTAGSTAPTG